MTRYSVEARDNWHDFEADTIQFSDDWVWLTRKRQGDVESFIVAIFNREEVVGVWITDAVAPEKDDD